MAFSKTPEQFIKELQQNAERGYMSVSFGLPPALVKKAVEHYLLLTLSPKEQLTPESWFILEVVAYRALENAMEELLKVVNSGVVPAALPSVISLMMQSAIDERMATVEKFLGRNKT